MNHCDHDQVLSVLREMQYELFLSIGHSAQEGSFLQGISNKCKASCMSVCSKTINSAVVEFTHYGCATLQCTVMQVQLL